MKRRLITSALPYVNNIPHLGNLVQTLSADVFARFCRLKGYDTLYICGTDEYGTATETRARELGISPRELCDRFYAVHAESYEWFQLSFDRFGRTSHPQHTTITQGLFQALHTHGYIKRKKIEQLYSEELTMFLADRYVRGQCPHCDYAEARGDQCEHCGNLLDPLDLIDPRCILDGSVPVKRPTEHLYIDLPKLRHRLEEWLQQSKAQTRWAKNALAMTRAWIRDGLRERAITRDLKWGIPVPLDGFRDKVFYVWFDAPIGYISITAAHTDRWREWWHNPDEVELTQFVGKDNIPFHAVVFPCTLLGSGERWTMLHNISSTEYLNYEGGQFSKSSGRGVFATDAMDSGIPSDVWRYYLIATRPETADSSFTWEEFYNRVNKEVIGVFANFFNRITAFVIKNYAGIVPSADGVASADSVASADDEGPDAKIDAFNAEDECFAPMEACIARIDSALERAELRSALRGVIDLAGLGNKLFQDHEPWKQIANAPRKVAQLLAALFVLAKNLTILISPFLPHTAQSCRAILGINQHLRWADMRTSVKHATLEPRALLFKRLQWKDIEMLQKKYSGTEKGAATQASPSASTATADNRRPPAAPADQHPPAAPADRTRPPRRQTDSILLMRSNYALRALLRLRLIRMPINCMLKHLMMAPLPHGASSLD